MSFDRGFRAWLAVTAALATLAIVPSATPAQTAEDGMAVVERRGAMDDRLVTVSVRCVDVAAVSTCAGRAVLVAIRGARLTPCRQGASELARVAFAGVPAGEARTFDAVLRRRARCLVERRCRLRVRVEVVPDRAPTGGRPDVAQPVVVLQHRDRRCARAAATR